MDTESASSSEVELVEESNEQKSAGNTKRGLKKRKKKGANEPQKPVSAYALFFRDTQAAIKAENPNATFGEISKIVASMWDSLSEEAKQVYKDKTEKAKRDYLKHLAAYRANLVSKGSFDGDEEDTQPLSVLKMRMTDLRSPPVHETGNNLPPPPKLQMAPTHHLAQQASTNAVVSSSYVSLAGASNVSNTQSTSSQPVGVHLTPISQVSVQQIILRPISTTVSGSTINPPPIQLRNIVPKAHSPVTFLPSKPGQIIKVLPPGQAASIASLNGGKNRIIKMSDMIRASDAAAVQELSAEANDVQPILQTLAQETDSSLQSPFSTQPTTTVASIQPSLDDAIPNSVCLCVRNGCTNPAISDPQWNNEYCSSECVVHHCRDVFDAWTSVRKVGTSIN